MDTSLIRILIVDCQGGFAGGLQEVLKPAGYNVQGVMSDSEAVETSGREHFNLIIKSSPSTRGDGLKMMEQVRELSPDTQFIFVSEGGSIRSAMEAVHLGVFDYLSWPVEKEQLLRSVVQALEYQAVVADDPSIRLRLRKRSEVDIFVGSSRLMKEVQEMLTQVATSDVTVLIEGESGVGKEIAARGLHERSHRSRGPFVAVNCAALTESLIESELFGHVRGAFTGAHADKSGRFELARGGTLFLDEISDLSALAQADVLRVLDDGFFRPVGSQGMVRADVRIIAASNRNIDELCEAGRFREDLYYRLNVVSLSLPPLRERSEDIPLLLQVFNIHFATKHRRKKKQFATSTINLLKTLPWPGNVRQLRNMVERLVLTCKETTIQPEHLPAKLTGKISKGFTLTLKPGITLAQAERELIRRTLSSCAENRTEAAKSLGISRRSLHYKINQYGIGKNKKPEG